MDLVTSEIKNKLLEIGYQNLSNPIVLAKYYALWTNWVWYVISINPKTEIGLAYITGDLDSFGYFSFDELKSIEGPLNMRIQRDLLWIEKPLSKIIFNIPSMGLNPSHGKSLMCLE